MELYSPFNKRLRKEITARAEMNKKKNKMLEVHIDENILKKYAVDKEINRIKKNCR